MKKFFVLGGNDAEMTVIAQILAAAGVEWTQPQKAWGDHLYGPVDAGLEVVEVRRPTGGGTGYDRSMDRVVGTIAGEPAVYFVECRPSPEWPAGHHPVVIDHHGESAGEPASILKVLAVLEEDGFKVSEPTRRWVEVVAANDAGYIPAMLALGATPEELARVRSLDRAAQGIAPAQEVEAERAIVAAEIFGRLTVVRLEHSKTAAVCDRMFGRYDQLLILSGDGEVNFFGDGALCAALKEKFEGWSGGQGLGKSPEAAFWGGYPSSHQEVLEFITQHLS